MDSILTSIKKLLGITEEYEHFDKDIVLYINTVFPILTQLGVGPKEGFTITDESTTWKEYLGDDKRFEFIKTYIYLKVRLLFDPPASGTIVESINQTIKEIEWRIGVFLDTPDIDKEGDNYVDL